MSKSCLRLWLNADRSAGRVLSATPGPRRFLAKPLSCDYLEFPKVTTRNLCRTTHDQTKTNDFFTGFAYCINLPVFLERKSHGVAHH